MDINGYNSPSTITIMNKPLAKSLLLGMVSLTSSSLLMAQNPSETSTIPDHPNAQYSSILQTKNIPSGNPTLTENDSETDSFLLQGTMFNISLPFDGGSTGYSWELIDANPGVLSQQGEPTFSKETGYLDAYLPPSVKIRPIGCILIERETWTFKIVSPGKTTLTFSYRRPWEKDTAPFKILTFTFRSK